VAVFIYEGEGSCSPVGMNRRFASGAPQAVPEAEAEGLRGTLQVYPYAIREIAGENAEEVSPVERPPAPSLPPSAKKKPRKPKKAGKPEKTGKKSDPPAAPPPAVAAPVVASDKATDAGE